MWVKRSLYFHEAHSQVRQMTVTPIVISQYGMRNNTVYYGEQRQGTALWEDSWKTWLLLRIVNKVDLEIYQTHCNARPKLHDHINSWCLEE